MLILSLGTRHPALSGFGTCFLWGEITFFMFISYPSFHTSLGVPSRTTKKQEALRRNFLRRKPGELRLPSRGLRNAARFYPRRAAKGREDHAADFEREGPVVSHRAAKPCGGVFTPRATKKHEAMQQNMSAMTISASLGCTSVTHAKRYRALLPDIRFFLFLPSFRA